MKRIIILIFLPILLLAGCSKPEVETPENPETPALPENLPVKAYAPVLESADADGQDFTFKWSAADALSLFDGNTQNSRYKLQNGFGKADATFGFIRSYGKSESDIAANVAVFPFAMGHEVKETEGQFEISDFVISAQQKSDLELPMAAVSVTREFQFTTPCAVLEFDVPDFPECPAYVKTLGTEALSGTATLVLREDGSSSFRLSKEYNIVNGVSGRLENGHAALRFTVLPGTFSKGLYLEVTGPDGKVASNIFPLKKAEAGKIYHCGTLRAGEYNNPDLEMEEGPQQDNEIWIQSKLKKPSALDGFVLKKSTENSWWKYEALTETTLTSVPEKAFFGRDDLTAVRLPQTVSLIGISAFEGCTSLTGVSFPSGLKKIAGNAFYYCPLPEVILPEGCEEIEDGAFVSDQVKKITLPSTLKKVGEKFLICDLQSMTYLPDHLLENFPAALSWNYPEEIDLYLSCQWKFFDGIDRINFAKNFWSKETWNSIHFIGEDELSEDGPQQKNEIWIELAPDEMPVGKTGYLIKQDRESGWWKYEKKDQSDFVKVPDKFFFLDRVVKVRLPEGVESIGSESFSECHQLTAVTMHEGLKDINRYAFTGCPLLKDVVFPESVEFYGQGIFDGAPLVEEITFGKNLKEVSLSALQRSSLKRIRVTAGPDKRMNNSDFLECRIQPENPQDIDLFLDRSWTLAEDKSRRPDLDAKTWNGKVWKSISITE